MSGDPTFDHIRKEADRGWRPTPGIRWAKVTGNTRELEQLWQEDGTGVVEWRKVLWET